MALCNELKDCILDDLKNVHHMPQAALDWIHDVGYDAGLEYKEESYELIFILCNTSVSR